MSAQTPVSILFLLDVIGDLLKTKQIPDPFYRENERDAQWVGESDWTYEREFKVSASSGL